MNENCSQPTFFQASLKSILTAGQLGNSTIFTHFLTPSWIEKVLQLLSRDTSTIQDGVAAGKSVDAMSTGVEEDRNRIKKNHIDI
jgi:hypothetical protein